MTDQQYQDLPSAKRRRLIFWAVLRGLLITTVLVVVYYLLPLDQPWDSGTAVRLRIGLLIFEQSDLSELSPAADRLAPISCLKFAVDVLEVRPDRVDGNVQLAGDLGGG